MCLACRRAKNLMYIENGDTPTGCVPDKKTIGLLCIMCIYYSYTHVPIKELFSNLQTSYYSHFFLHNPERICFENSAETPKGYRNGMSSLRSLGFSGISEKTANGKGDRRISPLQVSPEGFHRNLFHSRPTASRINARSGGENSVSSQTRPNESRFKPPFLSLLRFGLDSQ